MNRRKVSSCAVCIRREENTIRDTGSSTVCTGTASLQLSIGIAQNYYGSSGCAMHIRE